MIKKLFSFLTVIVLCALLIVPAFAEEVTGPDAIPDHRLKPLLVDEAGLLTEEQASALLKKLEQYSAELEADLAIVTVPDFGGKDRMAYADDFYDYNGYGQGENHDGMLFLIGMAERKWWITTTGAAMKLSEDDLQEAVQPYLSYLSSGDYSTAFNGIADNLYNKMYGVRHPSVDAKWIFIDLVIGFVIAFIIMKIITSNLKSVRSRVDANEYVVPNSLALEQSYDRFLYSNVVRTERAESSSSSGNGSHTSSSGTSHGGTGGSF
ncbi:MAG: TPM domain-containing protein [Clostridia bacterium]|nr:TPM domain-containing protein [Clostridia bacterium]